MKRCKYWPATVVVGALIGVAGAAPYPHRATPAAIDMGEAAAVAADAHITVTVALRLSNEEQLEPLLESVYRQGSPLYHQFLTPEQFRARFGPSADTIAALSRYFEAAGLQVTRGRHGAAARFG
jgi:subtilase family serine protease